MAVEIVEQTAQRAGSDEDRMNITGALASMYSFAGKYDMAVGLNKEWYELKKQTLEPDHPSTLNAMNNLANTYIDQGKYDLAEAMYKECLKN